MCQACASRPASAFQLVYLAGMCYTNQALGAIQALCSCLNLVLSGHGQFERQIRYGVARLNSLTCREG